MSEPIKCRQCDSEVDVGEDGNVTCRCPPEDEGPACPDLILPEGHGCPLCGWRATHVIDGNEIHVDGAIGYPHMAWSLDEAIGLFIRTRHGEWVSVKEAHASEDSARAINRK